MGYVLEQRWCGLFTTPESLLGPRVILRVSDDASLCDAIAEIKSTFEGGEVEVWVEGRHRTAQMHESLTSAGCTLRSRTVYLALAGGLRVASCPEELQIEEVPEERLGEWVTAQHMGSANSEVVPMAEALSRQLDVRRVELRDVGSLWLARLDGVVVSTLGFHEGADRLVNSLATRVPWRGRGIAQALLAALASDSEGRGCRSVLINADEDDWPVTLYRRMGFSDEVLLHGRYVLTS
jgi:GNAT superfamily N-acetyltransferase